MSYLLEILGRGLLGELAAAFRSVLADDCRLSTAEIEIHVAQEPRNPTHHRQLGLRLQMDHQHRAARAAFERALACDPRDRVSRLSLACALDELGHSRDAIDQLRTALDTDPNDAPTWFALGFCLE